ncbi:hypothetical protein ACTL6U_11675 [Rhodovibrionaceae bacterium A322]
MTFGYRVIATLLVVSLIGLIFATLWREHMDGPIPSYLGAILGALVGGPVWYLTRPKK